MYAGDHPGVYGHQERYEHRRAQEVAVSVAASCLEPTVVEALRESLVGVAIRVAPATKGSEGLHRCPPNLQTTRRMPPCVRTRARNRPEGLNIIA